MLKTGAMYMVYRDQLMKKKEMLHDLDTTGTRLHFTPEQRQAIRRLEEAVLLTIILLNIFRL
jgi:hypothetical protein